MLKNPFVYSNTNKRYYTIDYYFKTTYQSKVFKVALDAGFTCPNRDGSKGVGGCSFCSSLGSGEFGGNRKDDLSTQFENIKAMMHLKWPVAKYIAYFQAYTNTYGSVEHLKKTFEPILDKENVVGLAIATRPDCLDDDIVNYLATLNQKTDLVIELGLQTIFDSSAKYFNRGYDFTTFIDAFNRLKAHNIKVLVHLINGLPFETKEMMIESSRVIGKLHPWGIKIHSLYIVKNTRFAQQYLNNKFSLISKEDYIDVVIRQLENLPSDVVIERLTGDAKVDDLIAPIWVTNKVTILNEIDKTMAKENTYQGRLYYE